MDRHIEDDEDLRRCRQAAVLDPNPPATQWRELGTQFPDLVLLPNAANGDCQFWALAQALNGYTGSAKEELHARIRLLSLVPGEITAVQLRALAYCAFLLPSEETDGYLQHWKTNSADPSMGDAYRHARFLSDKRVDTLSATQRQEFFDILMDSSYTWGDETSLILLERLLRVRVDVLFDNHLQIRDMCHPANFHPIVYTIMNLSMKHYECVLHHVGNGVLASAFAARELPLPIVALHLRDCASAVDAYVRLVVPSASTLDPEVSAATVSVPSSAAIDPCTKDTLLEHVQACMAQQRQVPTTVVPPGPPPAMVEADGGNQHPGRMESKVIRLQCGLAVGNPAPYQPLFPPEFIPTRIARANPPRLWS